MNTDRKIHRMPCACCGFRTVATTAVLGAQGDRCPVCGWISDFLQEHDEQFRNGANRMSLIEARKNYEAKAHALGVTDDTLDEWLAESFPASDPLPGPSTIGG